MNVIHTAKALLYLHQLPGGGARAAESMAMFQTLSFTFKKFFEKKSIIILKSTQIKT